MKLKLFFTYKLLSAWIISVTYFSAFNIMLAKSEEFECGTQNLEDSSSNPLFVRQYEYPWKAAIFKFKDNLGRETEFWGTGNLVNKNTILTVAHIMAERGGDVFTHHLKKFKIFLGLRNLNDAKESGRKEFSVKKIQLHSNWRMNNIAIVTLTEIVNFSRYIRPICIPDESIASITTGQTSSWGYFDESQTFSETPRRSVIIFIDKQECLKREPQLTNLIGEHGFCAGAEGHPFCKGSTGIGFYVQKNGRFYLRGIVAGSVGCRTPNYATLTDVLKYRDFLGENNIQSEVPDEDCGVSSAVVGQVSHGDKFPHGLLPWLAALIKYENRKQMFICGGTLVTAKTVVTAAHCVHEKRASEGLKNYELRAALGANDLSDPYEPERKTMRVEKIIIHSTWNPAVVSRFTGDIALLVLEQNVAFDDYIKPICLSKSVSDVQSGVVAGWGRRENQTVGTSNDIPRKIDIPIVSDKICYEKEPRLAGAGWEESYCAGREGVSVCDGDSGSGFYVKVNGKYYLKGIVSNAVLHEECVNGFYAIFTDAVKYIPFISGA